MSQSLSGNAVNEPGEFSRRRPLHTEGIFTLDVSAKSSPILFSCFGRRVPPSFKSRRQPGPLLYGVE